MKIYHAVLAAGVMMLVAAGCCQKCPKVAALVAGEEATPVAVVVEYAQAVAADAVTPETIDELADIVDANPGAGRLHVSVYNPINRQNIALTSRGHAIHITPQFYKWLERKRAEGVLDFKPVEAN